ncbi:MAG: acyltransferase family protein [Bdellovibrionota bacterium]
MDKHGSLYRPDIDGLRAIAVWLVVIFHAFPGVVSGGFVGVDVFFVISGFLITRILHGDLESTRFSIVRFYSRRIRRIFPALLTILIAVFAIGWFGLFDYELVYVSRHIVWGLGFISNFMLWKEAGYFDPTSDLKPLIHLWSLAIEEQFYIVWPLLLFLLWKLLARRKRVFVAAIGALAFGSFAFNIWLSMSDSVADFYNPLARAWELLAGAILAAMPIVLPRVIGVVAPVLGLDGLFAAGFALTKSPNFPGWLALLPVVSAMLLIGTRDSWIHRNVLAHPLLVWFGLISYPLYLWHWPLLSYARVLSGQQPLSPFVFVGVVAVSIPLAWLTYRFIETPIRKNPDAFVARKVAILVAVTCVVLGAAFGAWKSGGVKSRSVNVKVDAYDAGLAWPWIRSEGCEKIYGSEPIEPFCASNVNDPKVFLLGDSHANQLFAGLLYKVPVISAGNGAPIDDVVIRMEKSDHGWSRNQASWEKSKAFLKAKAGQIKVVIIGAEWEALTQGDFLVHARNESMGRISLEALRPEEATLSRSSLLERSLLRTITFIESTGAHVVLMLDPPEITFNPRNCFRRLFVATSGCVPSIERSKVDARQAEIRKIFATIQATNPNVSIFDPIPIFCDQAQCRYFDDLGNPLYRDDSHVNAEGSRRIADRLLPVLISFLQ